MDRKTVQNRMARARELAQADNLPRAVHLLRELQQELSESDAPDSGDLEVLVSTRLNDYQNTLRAHTKEVGQSINEALREASENPSARRLDSVKNLLRTIQRLDIDGRYSEAIQESENRLNVIVSQQAQDRQERQAISEAQRLWQEAEELAKTGDVEPRVIIDQYYKRARDILSEALSLAPESTELIREQAKAQRLFDVQNRAADVYRSASIAGDYKRALEIIDSLPDGQSIPRNVFERLGNDVREIFQGDVTKEEARKEIREQGKRWALDKLAKYKQEVTRLLDSGQPHEAQDTILEKRENVEEFLERRDRDNLNELEKTVADEINQLERALGLANTAQATVAENPLKAWTIFKDARKTYGKSKQLDPYQYMLTEAVVRHLEVEEVRLRDALEERQFAEVERNANTLQRNYADIDAQVDSVLDRIGVLATEAREQASQYSRARELYEQIRNDMRRNPQNAYKLLQQLYELPLAAREDLENLPTISAELQSRFNFSEAKKRLREMVRHHRLDEVSESLEAAKQQRSQHPDDTEISTIIDNLTLHQAYLQAQVERDAGNLQAAMDNLDRLKDAVNHPDYKEATALRKQIEETREQVTQIDQQLDEVGKLLAGNDPESAYQSLQNLSPAEQSQMRRYESLRKDAEHAYKRLIEQELRQAERTWMQGGQLLAEGGDEMAMTIQSVQQSLDVLRYEIKDKAKADEWENRLRVFMDYDTARGLLDNPNATPDILQRAITKLEQAQQAAIDRAPQLVNDLNELLRDAHERSARARLQQLANASSSNVRVRADELIRYLTERQEQYASDGSIVMMMAEAERLVAQKSDDLTMRRRAYEALEAYAKRARDLAAQTPQTQQIDQRDVEKLLELAQQGHSITQDMQEVQRQLESDNVSGIAQARRTWEKALQPYVGSEWDLISQQWWDDQRRQTADALRQKVNIRNADAINIAHIRPLAMIYLLEPTDSLAKSMFQRLSNIALRLHGRVDNMLKEQYTGSNVKVPPDESGYEQNSNRIAGDQLLAYQQQETREMLDNLQAINDLSGLATGEDSAFISSDNRNVIRHASDEVQASITKLEGVLTNLNRIRGELKRFSLRLPDDIQQRDFTESRKILDGIINDERNGRQWEQHPAYQQALQSLQDAQESAEAMQRTLDSILEAVQVHDYREAQRLLDVTPQDDVDTYMRRDEILKTGDLSFKGWKELTNYVAQSLKASDRVNAFAEPFGVPEVGYTGQRTVVDWPSERQQIDALIKQGAFEQARSHIRAVIERPNDPDALSLKQAIGWLSDPLDVVPGISDAERQQADTVHKRYRLVMSKGSAYQKRVLNVLYDERLPLYVSWLEGTENLLEQVDKVEADWEANWQAWAEAIRAIGQALEDIGWRADEPEKRYNPAGRKLKRLRDAVQQARDAQATCGALCPERDKFKREMAANQHPLFSVADRILTTRDS
jgi:hypothetical protein